MSITTGQDLQEVASSSSLELPQPCRHFTISEILVATKNFDESLVVGRGGFGKVYKGTIINGASVLDVAIKRLDSTSNQGAPEFWAEVKILSKLRHCHLVSLIGYCKDEQEMILVYEYMPYGTLEDRLHKRGTSLHWLRRLKICIEAARGLDYLHTGTGVKHGVVHRDVKSSNILLDNSWAAKVSDFGLSKICTKDQSSTIVSTFVKGTFGYLDPNYFYTGKLTRKSDVYAFGVVLLEVLCGKQAVDTSREWGLAGWAQDFIKEGKLKQIVDSNLEGRASPKCLKEFARLACQCLHNNPNQRPTMAEVVVNLESLLALQEKSETTLRPVGKTIFGRKVPTFLYPNNGNYSVGVQNLKSLDIHLYTVGGENRMLHRFDFGTLSVATRNFSEAVVYLPDGLGVMYKGMLQNGQKIAIVQTSNVKYIQEYMMNEVSILVKLEHENLLSVLGYCIHETKVFLVYDFAPYATLRHLLIDTECRLLDWNKRYKILLGVGRLLLYLHKHGSIRVIHGNLTSNYILLDERLKPQLCNFGTARCLEVNETYCNVDVDAVCGTRGYMAPEYDHYGHLSCKADVFSFGVVALETISGFPSSRFHLLTGEHLQQYALERWMHGTSIIIDPRIGVDSSLMTRFVEIGLLCIQPEPADRPTMEEVVDMLLGGSSPTLRLSEIRERKLLESSNGINVSANVVDVVGGEETISDLSMR